MAELYDAIGLGYREYRRPDPRLAEAIGRALNRNESVVNVGAGAGSYEPSDRPVVAVEPATAMIRQRPAGSAPIVQASASDLPFRDDSFAAALAVLTVHHWQDRTRGLSELARVARRRVVVVTWDPSSSGFWLIEDYFPEIVQMDRRIFPTIRDFRQALGRVEVLPFLIPHDCVDGFLGAYWRRPRAYLDARVRAQSRRSRGSGRASSSPGSSGFDRISTPARGSDDTPTSSSKPSSTWATASSSQRADRRSRRRGYSLMTFR